MPEDEGTNAYWTTLESMLSERGYRAREILGNWQAYVHWQDISRFLSHYELFKFVIDLPGSVVDLGVYRGASLFTWAALSEIFCRSETSRDVYGFDSFEGLQGLTSNDGPPVPEVGKYPGGFRANRAELETLRRLHNASTASGTSRVQMVVGRIEETLPQFIEEHPGFSISLLHFDLDLYEPTKIALKLLYPLVQDGGVVCFDEYGQAAWPGETRAVNEYFAEIGEQPVFKKHPFTPSPSAYFIKKQCLGVQES